MILYFGLIIALFITMALIPPLMAWAERLNFIDLPDDRKVHKGAIPRIGGVAMVVGALIPMVMWLPPVKEVFGFLVGVGVIFVFGVWDDRKNLNYKIKFFGQFVAVLVVVLYGGVVIEHIPLVDEALPSYLAIPLTIFAILGITNAINLADGLDGLAGGMTLLSFGAIALLAYMSDGNEVLLIALVVIGSILGFLRFNTYPARIFMGDGGSQFLGFSVGILAILLTQKVNTALSPVLPLLLLGLPILDTFMVMGQRIYEGRSPFSPDKNHLHHKLLELGFDHYEAVFLIYITQAILVSAAYFLRFQSDVLLLLIYFTFCASVYLFFNYARRIRLRINNEPIVPSSFIGKRIEWLKQGRWLVKGAYYFALAGIPAYLLVMVLFAQSVPKDSSIAVVSWVLLVMMVLISIKNFNRPFHIMERACLYVIIVFAVYLTQIEPGKLSEFVMLRNVFFALLIVAIAIGFRFAGADIFRVSTLDVLVIFLAMVVPNMSETLASDSHFGEGVAMVIVLFYGVELVLANMWRRWGIMRLAAMGTLAVLALRGMRP